MHFRFFPILAALAAVFHFSHGAFAQTKKKTEGHRIQFKVKGYKDTTAVIAHYYGDNQYIAKDTARFDTKGNLIFEGKKDLPEGFQTAEFVMDHGFLDLIANRKDLKNTIAKLLVMFAN